MIVDAIIPARMGSSRYPGKPLCDIQGMTMVEHVFRRTSLSNSVDNTYVATPDKEIKEEVESFGGNAIMTGSHTRPVSRVAEAAKSTDGDIIVVVQGDEPLVYPDMIDDAIEPLLNDDEIGCVNLAKSIDDESDFRDQNNVKVVVDRDWNALYFSREPIPNLRDVAFSEFDVYKQVCIMPFRREFLFNYLELEETQLVLAESIDMLRLLEHGYNVKIVETDRDVHAVDTESDHERVNEMMEEDALFGEY
ncbi:3-deoxy-manno-octulosonate cytidylyltransferase [Halobellus clavatus]|uniref:3-deoxy-manno-octulosonate cytidylyltransferase (CMP-KDO synthetase) n=1 Tax=Halobellus clavatus TaxID=660517 RepID=A0A1H3JRZ5_9EURY|nr:3-deoxy-manno-octulosonate cytidylyltransferase [Halobellus clavatus]SDY42275.1 3-deoxy-manno-octulosonate cytidylyltransferase (CMP-KDO synthetase) [Halobellus clavatus]